ncbi:MAG: hypothetical protein EON87_22465, partial [Brevundimonas sp.]
MTSRLFAVLIALITLLSATPGQAKVSAQTPAQTDGRRIAITFDDLPFQPTQPGDLCDPVRATAFTDAFLDMLRPLDSHATGFVNEGQVCEAERATLLPRLLDAWLET